MGLVKEVNFFHQNQHGAKQPTFKKGPQDARAPGGGALRVDPPTHHSPTRGGQEDFSSFAEYSMGLALTLPTSQKTG